MRRILKLGALGASAGLVYDYNTQEKIIIRNLKTIRCGLNILYQYKIRFDASNADEIHEMIAKDIYEVCHDNDGLYVKFGQGMASVDHVLPPAYFKWLQLLQDKVKNSLKQQAKQVPYEEIKKVVERELQKPLDEVFEYVDPVAVASASIAQVHKAKLKTGEVVALKVQKPNIKKQFSSDMFMHWLICGVVQYAFDLPLLEFQQSIEENLEKEINFNIEKDNAELARLGLEKCKRTDIYIPQSYFSTQRVMVSEWIDGIKITHTQELNKAGINTEKALKSVIECFAEQIFVTGFVHCDPHPGNIFVRKLDGKQQVVLLDFGLCLKVSNEFRLQYAEFWRALFLQDHASMKNIMQSWGIGNEEMFASMQLMRPYNKYKPVHAHQVTKEDVLKMQLQMKEDFRKVMKEVKLFPKELLFVNRNMNLVRSVNKKCGSLVNRVNVMARFAAQGSKIKFDLLNGTGYRLPNSRGGFWFETRLLFYGIVYKLVTLWLKMRGSKGFEDLVEMRQKKAIQEMYLQYGFKVPDEHTYDA